MTRENPTREIKVEEDSKSMKQLMQGPEEDTSLICSMEQNRVREAAQLG